MAHGLIALDRSCANKLAAAGVRVIYCDYPGMIHGFFNYGAEIQDGLHLSRQLAKGIRTVLAET